MAAEHLDDLRRPAQPGRGADVDADRTGADEAVDEVLGEAAVDLVGTFRRTAAPVAPGVVHVDVEPVLVRDVLRPERTAVPPRHVAYPDGRRVRMRTRVLVDHAEHDSDEAVVSPAAARAVRTPVEQRVPGEEVRACGRKLDAADEPAVPRQPDRPGVSPVDGGRLPVNRRRLPEREQDEDDRPHAWRTS